MLMTYKLLSFMVMAVLVLTGTAATAQTILPCTPGTLAAYQAMRTDCQIGIELFQGFTFSSSGTGTLDTNTNIEVTPVTFSDGESAGFTFSQINGAGMMTPFSVGAGLTANYNIQYEFFFAVDPSASNAEMGMDPPFGNVTIDQYYCPDVSTLNFNGPNGAPNCETFSDAGNFNFVAQDLRVTDLNPPTSWTTGIVPLNPVVNNFAFVLTTIKLVGGASTPSGFDSVTGENFIAGSSLITSIAPEPSTIVLVAGGLLALALRKRLW